MAEIALRNARAKHKVTRLEIKVGDMVRIRVKPIESRGSYRVNEIAWSEKVRVSPPLPRAGRWGQGLRLPLTDELLHVGPGAHAAGFF